MKLLLPLLVLQLFAPNNSHGDEKCGPPLWYRHCRVEKADYAKSGNAISINLRLRDCKKNLSLDLDHEVNLNSKRRTPEDQASLEHIVSGTYRDITKTALEAKDQDKRVSIQVTRLFKQNCKIVPITTARSISIDSSVKR